LTTVSGCGKTHLTHEKLSFPAARALLSCREDSLERRIAAILAADMVGFSRLTELDEAGTLQRQKDLRLSLIEPTIRRHNGEIIKLTGDGMIVEFTSVVEATQCAVIIQKEMVARSQDEPEDRRIL
jgi:adenylate cyclase